MRGSLFLHKCERWWWWWWLKKKSSRVMKECWDHSRCGKKFLVYNFQNFSMTAKGQQRFFFLHIFHDQRKEKFRLLFRSLNSYKLNFLLNLKRIIVYESSSCVLCMQFYVYVNLRIFLRIFCMLFSSSNLFEFFFAVSLNWIISWNF